MTVTPDGILSKPVDVLADMISTSATFQTFVGAPTAQVAKNRVYVSGKLATGTDQFERPFALISTNDFRIELNSFGTGTLDVMFEADVSSENQSTYSDATFAFMNDFGNILDELMASSYTGGNLLIQRMAFTIAPQRANFNEIKDNVKEDYYQAAIQVEYGVS